MAAMEISSPNVSLNGSLGLNTSNVRTPNSLNKAKNFRFLMPVASDSKIHFTWSPAAASKLRSPNLSPIVNSAESSSKFLKRRDFIFVRDDESGRREKGSRSSNVRKSNSNLDATLSVATVLDDLQMSHLKEIFDREEITLTVLFTLNDADLQTIGIESKAERDKILYFINDFNTPKKTKKIPVRNVLIRH